MKNIDVGELANCSIRDWGSWKSLLFISKSFSQDKGVFASATDSNASISVYCMASR